MFSLAGVPPLVGFFGKFYVLWRRGRCGLIWLAVAGVVASVIGAFYYLRIVYYMYFGEEGDALDAVMPPTQQVLLVASAAIMVVGVVNLFGVEPRPASRRRRLSAEPSLPADWPSGAPAGWSWRGRQHHGRGCASVPGLTGPAWILGLRQTAGRGRRGRPWMDPPGNFAATLALFPQEPAATWRCAPSLRARASMRWPA
jgi:hypothetical protein